MIGEISASLGQLINLTELSLDNNQLSGKKLRKVDLYFCHLLWSFALLLTHSLTHSLARLFHSPTHSSLTCSLIYSLAHQLANSFNYSLAK